MGTPTRVLFGHEIPGEQATPVPEIVAAKLYRFKLALKQTLSLKQVKLTRREGLILMITDALGNTGLSEISPLPGFSPETLETAASGTTMLLDKMINSAAFTKRYLERGNVKNWLEMPSIANFGLETALLSLLASTHHLPLGSFLFGQSSREISLNGLINQNLPEWPSETEKLLRSGYTTLKIKVGRINPELEALGIKRIREISGPDINLRLDANRAWDLETAIHFGKDLKDANIEYIEEPLQDPMELPLFFNACEIPFALDETLHHIRDHGISFSTYTGLRALVLKPTLIACMPRFLALVRQAKKEGVLAVLSSSYESGIGLSILAQLAGAISGSEIAVGLNTGAVYQEDLVEKSPVINNGKLKIDQLTMNDLKLDHCELIYEF